MVIEEALPGEDCDQLLAEMAPFLDATPHGLHGLGGTRRCVRRTPLLRARPPSAQCSDAWGLAQGALVARSPTSHKMISHPAVLSLVNSVLGEQQLRGDAVRIGGHKGKGDTEKVWGPASPLSLGCSSWFAPCCLRLRARLFKKTPNAAKSWPRNGREPLC